MAPHTFKLLFDSQFWCYEAAATPFCCMLILLRLITSPLLSFLNDCHTSTGSGRTGGRTALHLTAGWGDVQTMRLLIAAGADVNATAAGGLTPLHLAVSGNTNCSQTFNHQQCIIQTINNIQRNYISLLVITIKESRSIIMERWHGTMLFIAACNC